MKEMIELDGKQYETIKLLGKGKGGYSYLIQSGNSKLVLKKIHHEPCVNYEFGNKMESEIHAYQIYEKMKIRVPKLISYDMAKEWIFKEYIDGLTIAEYIVHHKITDAMWQDIFEIYSITKKNNVNPDYFPTNFVVSNNGLYYIDYETNEYMEEWDFKNWGIYFWLNGEGFKEFLEQNNNNAICLPNSPKPIWEPFQEKALDLIQTYMK